MSIHIQKQHSKYYMMALWLVPSLMEIAIYLFLTMITLFISSQDRISELLFIDGDFNPIRVGIGSVDALLQQIIGEKVAGSLSLAIFWGIVGLLVNVIWWVGSNFSTELNNDLVFSKYVHPKDTNPKTPLREFFEKTIFRTAVALIAIVYTNLFISDLLPRITTRFSYFIQDWSTDKYFASIFIAFISQIILLHIFTILIRFITLRKQLIDF